MVFGHGLNTSHFKSSQVFLVCGQVEKQKSLPKGKQRAWVPSLGAGQQGTGGGILREILLIPSMIQAEREAGGAGREGEGELSEALRRSKKSL